MTKYTKPVSRSKLIFLFLSFLVSYTIIISLTQCSKDSTSPDSVVYPDSNLSFIQHIQPIFLRNCVSSGCHETISPANGLDLESSTPNFTSVNGTVIIPFDADQSRLYRVLLSDYAGISRMPRNRAPLAENMIRAIRTWINEGALITN